MKTTAPEDRWIRPDEGVPADRKLKIFISYSRMDEDFAQELLTGLELVEFEPYLDKHDIAAGEDWEARLGRLIEAADTVVFVVSPDAISSERCAWEVDRTVSLKKRLLPVVWRRVDEAQVPERLKQLNYIFFDGQLTFAASLKALAVALRTDVDWIREHTRLGELALRWNSRERAEALLLRGDELAAAKAWIADPPQYTVEPTLLHHAFIQAGEDAELARTSAERQRLAQMAAAQAEREAAQADREKALDDMAAAVRRAQRALIIAAGSFACIVVGAIGVYNQAYLIRQYHWHWVMRPSVLTTVQETEMTGKVGTMFAECGRGCPTMVVVPSGKFVMGGSELPLDEGPLRTVTFAKPFAVAKFELTFAEWDHCVNAGACPPAASPEWGRGSQPVVQVSWNDAKKYVGWLKQMTGKDYRLLSESEWEYAARAGTTSDYFWGQEIGVENASCYICGNKWDGKRPSPVGSFKPNPFGLHDMHGNVWEWVEDIQHANYVGAPIDGSAWQSDADETARVIRGGGWGNQPYQLRVSYRGWNRTGSRRINVGLRVARSLNP